MGLCKENTSVSEKEFPSDNLKHLSFTEGEVEVEGVKVLNL